MGQGGGKILLKVSATFRDDVSLKFPQKRKHKMRILIDGSSVVFERTSVVTSHPQVMFRFNFLVVMLCLVMNRPYQFYYFVPLVSFWFTVVYVALALPPRLPSFHSADSKYRTIYCVL